MAQAHSVMHTSIGACFLCFFYNHYNMSLFNSKNVFIYLLLCMPGCLLNLRIVYVQYCESPLSYSCSYIARSISSLDRIHTCKRCLWSCGWRATPSRARPGSVRLLRMLVKPGALFVSPALVSMVVYFMRSCAQ